VEAAGKAGCITAANFYPGVVAVRPASWLQASRSSLNECARRTLGMLRLTYFQRRAPVWKRRLGLENAAPGLPELAALL
jgi:hypothetical protein